MKVLIIGGGGREHALAWKVAQSPSVTRVFVAPGNAGTAAEDKVENVAISAQDIDHLVEFAIHNAIELTIVGPEVALSLGVVDSFQQKGLAIFGPTQAAAQLESSKAFCKTFMQDNDIPTAKFATFDDKEEALNYLNNHPLPIVIKADGLAAGKGVVIASTQQEAITAIDSMLSDNLFGAAGHQIVIEEFLEGEELSYIVMSDGHNVLPLASSQDHKRRDDGDQGPNTGGMGAYSPSPCLTTELEQTILHKVIEPTIKVMRDNGTPYVGFLYAGIMIAKDGTPNVLEFNCRLGDPETQVILMRLESDLVELIQAILAGKANSVTAKWKDKAALTVVLAAGGYPLAYNKGDVIAGLDTYLGDDYKIFHAGTKQSNENIVTNGGRVLAATALGDSIVDAQKNAYTLAKHIDWPSVHYRKDIGYRAIKE